MDKAEGFPLSTRPEAVSASCHHTTPDTRVARPFPLEVDRVYARNVQTVVDNYYTKDGEPIKDSRFVIDPATRSVWFDAGWSTLNVQRGPCMSNLISSYLAVGG